MEEPETNESTNTHSGALVRLEAMFLRHRVGVNILVHSFLFALALLLAYLVRFDAGWGPGGGPRDWFIESYLLMLPLFVVVKLLLFGRFRLLRGGWQYASLRDVANILAASFLFLLGMFCMVYLFHWGPRQAGRRVPYVGDYFATYSRGVMLLDFLATVFLVSTARLGFRLYREERRPIATEGVTRVLIVGAGNAAETIIREIFRMRVERYRVVGMVDDDESKKGIFIHGLPVLGTTADIRRICEEHEVEEIIIALPSATQKQLRRVIELCTGTKLKFQSLPSVGDLIGGRVTVSQIRPVDINDLLSREQVELDTEALGRFLSNRRVLITGAGGSIGAEMCRQVSRFQPAELILIEQAETPLFDIENELKKRHPDILLDSVICDIYDRERVMHIWERYHPEVVIHAAAHKHVPLMERNACEALKNNILGTTNAADASCRYGADEFVLISTDKAVNPSSVMGASKRVAEMYTQALNGRDNCKTQFKSVRFGNVLDSAGSVVPTFRKQIASGGPVTVTDPEMRRYFMTIPEAVQLVLQASATGSGGQIYLLDMGEPVKIVDLARQMITLSGFRPGEDIDVTFTGLRPGEKLFEELRTKGEDIAPTVHPKVLVWKHRSVEWEKINQAVKELKALENSSDYRKIVSLLQEIIPEYDPMNPPTDTIPGSRREGGGRPANKAPKNRQPKVR
ncbi:MAG: polysaccharide biosynthesis protein [Planctomycetota bacterium]|jgi:FlaA1/EpsC-like NDP-sugar epimerase